MEIHIIISERKSSVATLLDYFKNSFIWCKCLYHFSTNVCPIFPPKGSFLNADIKVWWLYHSLDFPTPETAADRNQTFPFVNRGPHTRVFFLYPRKSIADCRGENCENKPNSSCVVQINTPPSTMGAGSLFGILSLPDARCQFFSVPDARSQFTFWCKDGFVLWNKYKIGVKFLQALIKYEENDNVPNNILSLNIFLIYL